MKKKLKVKYIEALEEKLSKARLSYEIAKKDTIEAEGRMITRYDSTKTETAWLADGYLKDVKELEIMIEKLQNDTEIANLGDCIKLDKYKNKEFFGFENVLLDKKLLEEKRELFIQLIGTAINESINIEINGEYFEYHVREVQKATNIEGISINSFVVLEDEDGIDNYFYLVNYLGGMELKVDEKEVFCVSRQTPIAMLLFGKKIGDSVRLNPETDFEFFIKDVK